MTGLRNVNLPSWEELTSKGAISMVVRQQFLFDGEIRRPGERFSCDSARRMRQLYEQRKIQPAISVGEAMQQVQPPPAAIEPPESEVEPPESEEPRRGWHGQFVKRSK